MQWYLDKNSPRQDGERADRHAPLVNSWTWFVLISTTADFSGLKLLTNQDSLFCTCWFDYLPPVFLVLSGLHFILTPSAHLLIFARYYFAHYYFVPLITAAEKPSSKYDSRGGHSSKLKAIVQSCLVCPRLQSKAVHSSCSISVSAVEGCLSQQFTHCHKWQIHCSSPSSALLSCIHLLMVNKTDVHFWISRDLQSFSLIFAPPEMHPGPSKPTRLLHVSYDPVKGHFRPHVACVVDRLPAGLQWKAHFCQLHYCRLVYFWSCERDKHGINNCTVAAADSTQSGACRWKPNKILCWRFL